eukprot:12997012-Ditylum_brightwellii.AAC.1
MDSYYLTNDGQVMMRSMKVPYSASLNRCHFYNLQCAWAKVGEVRHPCDSIEQEDEGGCNLQVVGGCQHWEE